MSRQLRDALDSGDHDDVAYLMTIAIDAERDGLIGLYALMDMQANVLLWRAQQCFS